ncbi:MAG: hypothetical protein JWL90_1850 [Chthoniobacteraceae bacterium]|nr:hypothetical protein [Chthoniobacteraceae bacterium]
MALKATIYKANLQLSDMDRQLYRDQALTIARHPSETDERMMIRLLVFALNLPAGDSPLELAKDLWEADEPSLWQKSMTGEIEHWIEIGQPDEKRLMRASARAERVSVYSFNSKTASWWSGIQTKVTRARNLSVWQVQADQSEGLAALAQRSMQLNVTVQDGVVWMDNGQSSVEILPVRLYGTP